MLSSRRNDGDEKSSSVRPGVLRAALGTALIVLLVTVYAGPSLLTSAALNLYRLESYAAAETLLEFVLAIQQSFAGQTSRDVARTFSNLGRVQMGRGDISRAELSFRRALSILSRTLPATDPDVVASLFDLAAVYERSGRQETSDLTAQRAQAGLQNARVPAGGDLAQSIALYGKELRRSGRQSRAEEMERLAGIRTSADRAK